MRNKLTTFLFLALLLGGALTGLFLPDKAYSASEKRKLAQAPTASWRAIRSGQFGSDLESYLADQFPARDRWVTVKTITERVMGKRESGGVYFADDGYLIDIHTAFYKKQLDTNIAAIRKLTESLAEDNIPVSVMLVPTAACVLADKLPPYAPNADQRAVIAYAKKQGLPIVDVTDALLAHKDEYLYYRTDHHWTSLGAYYAYAAWRESRGLDVAPLSDWTREVLCDNFRGTTYNKTEDPFAAYDTIEAYYKTLAHRVDYNGGYQITDSIYERSFLEGTNQYGVFLNSNQSTTVVFSKGKGKLLIIKDSYANTFAQFAIEDYAETHLIDMRFFRGSVLNYIRKNGITEVLVLYNAPNATTDADLARVGR
ncbi:MAG: hypothetical protein IK055_01800 [Lachnospiraceae bacterium]|nr:hypothetical protein [Lachnospiraceae bacterium]